MVQPHCVTDDFRRESDPEYEPRLDAAREVAQGPVVTYLDSASVRMDRHLEDDQETKGAFRAQIVAMADARLLSDSTSLVWLTRAFTAETVLGATEVECQLCLQEVELLRQGIDGWDPGVP